MHNSREAEIVDKYRLYCTLLVLVWVRVECLAACIIKLIDFDTLSPTYSLGPIAMRA